MKKLMSAAMLSLLLAPTLTLANTSMNTNFGSGACGSPPQSNPGFCGCFLTQSSTRCKEVYGAKASQCRENVIASSYKAVSNAPAFCAKFQNLMPADVSPQECADDISFFKTSC